MDYEAKIREYLKLRRIVEEIDRRVKVKKAEFKQQMTEIERELTDAAHNEGLKNIPTPVGLGYWSTHYKCTSASPEAFFQYVQEHDAWDLMEKRPSKAAVKGFVEEHGAPPPGINFGAVQVFNVREDKANG